MNKTTTLTLDQLKSIAIQYNKLRTDSVEVILDNKMHLRTVDGSCQIPPRIAETDFWFNQVKPIIEKYKSEALKLELIDAAKESKKADHGFMSWEVYNAISVVSELYGTTLRAYRLAKPEIDQLLALENSKAQTNFQACRALILSDKLEAINF